VVLQFSILTDSVQRVVLAGGTSEFPTERQRRSTWDQKDVWCHVCAKRLSRLRSPLMMPQAVPDVMSWAHCGLCHRVTCWDDMCQQEYLLWSVSELKYSPARPVCLLCEPTAACFVLWQRKDVGCEVPQVLRDSRVRTAVKADLDVFRRSGHLSRRALTLGLWAHMPPVVQESMMCLLQDLEFVCEDLRPGADLHVLPGPAEVHRPDSARLVLFVPIVFIPRTPPVRSMAHWRQFEFAMDVTTLAGGWPSLLRLLQHGLQDRVRSSNRSTSFVPSTCDGTCHDPLSHRQGLFDTVRTASDPGLSGASSSGDGPACQHVILSEVSWFRTTGCLLTLRAGRGLSDIVGLEVVEVQVYGDGTIVVAAYYDGTTLDAWEPGYASAKCLDWALTACVVQCVSDCLLSSAGGRPSLRYLCPVCIRKYGHGAPRSKAVHRFPVSAVAAALALPLRAVLGFRGVDGEHLGVDDLSMHCPRCARELVTQSPAVPLSMIAPGRLAAVTRLLGQRSTHAQPDYDTGLCLSSIIALNPRIPSDDLREHAVVSAGGCSADGIGLSAPRGGAGDAGGVGGVGGGGNAAPHYSGPHPVRLRGSMALGRGGTPLPVVTKLLRNPATKALVPSNRRKMEVHFPGHLFTSRPSSRCGGEAVDPEEAVLAKALVHVLAAVRQRLKRPVRPTRPLPPEAVGVCTTDLWIGFQCLVGPHCLGPEACVLRVTPSQHPCGSGDLESVVSCTTSSTSVHTDAGAVLDPGHPREPPEVVVDIDVLAWYPTCNPGVVGAKGSASNDSYLQSVQWLLMRAVVEAVRSLDVRYSTCCDEAARRALAWSSEWLPCPECVASAGGEVGALVNPHSLFTLRDVIPSARSPAGPLACFSGGHRVPGAQFARFIWQDVDMFQHALGADPKRLALIVGVDAYNMEDLMLPGCSFSSCSNMHLALSRSRFTVKRVKDRDSSLEGIKRAVTESARRLMDVTDGVFLYAFTGHGKSISGCLHIVPVDYNGKGGSLFSASASL
jgi:hypothetical protein